MGTIICALIGAVWALPFVWMITASLRPDSGGADIASLIPQWPLSVGYFQDALIYADWGTLYRNTIIFSVGILSAQLFSITTAGYVFAFVPFRGRELVFRLFLVQLMLWPIVLMVPNMVTLKSLGLLDTLLGAMLPYMASAFGIFMVRQAFRSVPKEMIEAAQVEGANLLHIFILVLLPAIWPTLLAFSIVSLTTHWNEYLWPLMVLSDMDTHTLTIGLVSFTTSAESGAEWGLIAAGTLLVCLPITLTFVLFQKHFISSFGFTQYK
ncbi:carbohydrate ABC transporter permease [Pseudodesulfovibrio alkaliphilus]|nr:carbohydrate ABC transporter permease [Pseudodesulfovibrio alkaliphilus]